MADPKDQWFEAGDVVELTGADFIGLEEYSDGDLLVVTVVYDVGTYDYDCRLLLSNELTPSAFYAEELLPTNNYTKEQYAEYKLRNSF